MTLRSTLLIGLIAVFGLSACGTIQHREGRGTYCRDETRCPFEVN